MLLLQAVNTAELTPSSSDPKKELRLRKDVATVEVVARCDAQAGNLPRGGRKGGGVLGRTSGTAVTFVWLSQHVNLTHLKY